MDTYRKQDAYTLPRWVVRRDALLVNREEDEEQFHIYREDEKNDIEDGL